MARRARRPLTRLWVPTLSVLAMLGSGTWLVTQEDGFGGPWGGWGHGCGGTSWSDGSMMDGPGMGGLRGDGERVANMEQARDRARTFARSLGPDLEVGEVMQFSNHYYAELQDPDGAKATEVLIGADSGAVQLEFGPARMWNTRFGMMGGGRGPGALDAEEAEQLAQDWLNDRADGLGIDEAEAFPGYYTLHTVEDGRPEGMLSVNSATGDVWYHSWHGDFEGMSEGP